MKCFYIEEGIHLLQLFFADFKHRCADYLIPFQTLNTLEICYISKTKMYLHDRMNNCVFNKQLAAILIFRKIQM